MTGVLGAPVARDYIADLHELDCRVLARLLLAIAEQPGRFDDGSNGPRLAGVLLHPTERQLVVNYLEQAVTPGERDAERREREYEDLQLGGGAPS